MTGRRLFAWILLSVPESGGLHELIAKADWINHAIPTHGELQRSLGWLKAQGLVRKAGRNFLLTADGAGLLARAHKPRQSAMKAWDSVAAELGKLAEVQGPPDDVTLEELEGAYAAYRKGIRRRYRKPNRG